jgi:Lsr2
MPKSSDAPNARANDAKVDGVARLSDSKIIRRWAQANKIELPKRGRIRQRIIDQFEAHEEARQR